MSCLVEFSMSPLGEGTSVSKFVAGSLEIVDTSGLPYQFHAMGTILEGDLADCLRVIERCYERMSADCERITCSIKIDSRKGAANRLAGKVQSVEKRVGRKLPT